MTCHIGRRPVHDINSKKHCYLLKSVKYHNVSRALRCTVCNVHHVHVKLGCILFKPVVSPLAQIFILIKHVCLCTLCSLFRYRCRLSFSWILGLILQGEPHHIAF